MFWNKIRLTGSQLIDIPLYDATPTDPYILKAIDGLQPPEVDVYMQPNQQGKNTYQRRRPRVRKIVIRIALNPNYAAGQRVDQLRENLYQLLTPAISDNVTVNLLNGNTILTENIGYCEKFEAVPFSKDPEIQITLAMVNPYLLAPNMVNVSNPSKSTLIIPNAGNGPAGINIDITLTAQLANFYIYDFLNRGLGLIPPTAYASGTRIVINTEDKYVRMYEGGSSFYSDILFHVINRVTWHTLVAGNNPFTFSSSSFNYNNVSYRPTYWGV